MNFIGEVLLRLARDGGTTHIRPQLSAMIIYSDENAEYISGMMVQTFDKAYQDAKLYTLCEDGLAKGFDFEPVTYPEYLARCKEYGQSEPLTEAEFYEQEQEAREIR